MSAFEEILVFAIPSVVIGLLVVLVIVLVIRSHKRATSWTSAIRALAEQLGIEHEVTDNSYDSAHGRVGGIGISVIRWDMRMRPQIGLGFGTAGGGTSLVLKQRGVEPDKRFLTEPDWESYAGVPVQIGDAAFDDRIDLRGASPVLLQALKAQPELRQLILKVIGEMGAYILSDEAFVNLEIFAPLARSADDIVSYLRPMLELARWLEAPLAPHEPVAAGAPVVGPLNRLHILSTEQCLAELQRFLPAVLSPMGAGQAYLTENKRVDWRGAYAGLPLRVMVDSSGGVELTVKAQHQHGALVLHWDAAKIPAVGTAPAWDASERSTVFVDKGVFIHGDAQAVDVQLQRLRALPAELRSAITGAMRRDDVERLEVSDEEIEVHLRPRLSDLMDPAGQLARVVELAGSVAKHLQETPADPNIAQQPAGADPSRFTCQYCSTLFLLGPRPFCPNCGAPAQG